MFYFLKNNIESIKYLYLKFLKLSQVLTFIIIKLQTKNMKNVAI